MRVLVCGSRDLPEEEGYERVRDHLVMLDGLHRITLIIEGEARGADTFARLWASVAGIPVMKFPADWKKYGRAAGPIRNKQMLDEGKPDLVVAFPSKGLANSKGTKNMVTQAKAAGIRTIVIEE